MIPPDCLPGDVCQTEAVRIGTETCLRVSDLPLSLAFSDSLTMLEGTLVLTKADWETRRRPELKNLLQHDMYGCVPAPAELRTDGRLSGGAAAR